jgi:hypothetical protein
LRDVASWGSSPFARRLFAERNAEKKKKRRVSATFPRFDDAKRAARERAPLDTSSNEVVRAFNVSSSNGLFQTTCAA